MAIVAGIAAGNMRRMLANGSDTVMAGTATANDLGVIDGDYGCPYRRVMAIFTNIGGLYMREVFAGCVRSVMATDTVTCDVYMIEVCWHPCGRDVTVITGVAAGNVGRVLAGRANAVVATDTIADHTEVIENSR